MAHPPAEKLHPRAGSDADKLVKEQKRQAAQEELAKVRLEEEELEKCPVLQIPRRNASR